MGPIRRQSKPQLKRNEQLFAEANDRIKNTIKNLSPNMDVSDLPVRFSCECSSIECCSKIPLFVSEYEQVRSHAHHFFVKPGHELPQIERIVDRTPKYVVVEKVSGP